MDEETLSNNTGQIPYDLMWDEFNQLYERFDVVPLLQPGSKGKLYLDHQGKLIVGVFTQDAHEQLDALNTMESLTHISPSSHVKREQRGELLMPTVVNVRQYSTRYKDRLLQIEKTEQALGNLIDAAMQDIDIAPTIQPEHKNSDLDFDR